MGITKHNFILTGVCVAAVFVCGTFAATSLYAAEFRLDEDVQIDVTDRLTENLYLMGETVTMHGSTTDDVMALGKDVFVTGGVEKDVFAAGALVGITGTVYEDVRAVGAEVTIGGRVDGDILAAGGAVVLDQSLNASSTVRIFGDHVVANGVFHDNVAIWAGSVELQGDFRGDVTIHTDRSIVVNDNARIAGSFTYSAPKKAIISENTTIIGTTTFTDPREGDDEPRGGMSGMLAAFVGTISLFSFISFLIASILCVTLFPKFSERMVLYELGNGGTAVLLGLGSWIGLAFISVLLILSLIGMIVGLGLGAFFIALALLANVLSSIMAGALLSNLIKREAIVDWRWTMMGAAILELIKFIPIVGWILNVLLILSMMGAMVKGMYTEWWMRRKC